MNFSPAYITALLVNPLRYLYSKCSHEELRWDPDVKITGLEIDSINNFHKIAIQEKPRILISRGQYTVLGSGLTDNMAESKTVKEAAGLKDRINFILIEGLSQVMVEARAEGTCEKLVDLTSHYIAWAAPAICDTMGFKNFANNLAISPCTPSKENTEIFSCTINIPWRKEEQWKVQSDGIDLKNFLLSIEKL